MMLSRVGIIGDVHAEDVRLEAVLKSMEPLDLDAIVCVGDVVDGFADAERCCDLLRDARVDCVRGNHDRWFLTGEMRGAPDATPSDGLTEASREWLTALPPTRSFVTPMGNLLLCHGLGSNDMRRLTQDDSGYALEANVELQDLLSDRSHALVINGHTHGAMVRAFPGLTVINAGTLRRDHDPVFAVADFMARTVQYHLIGDDLGIVLGQVHRI